MWPRQSRVDGKDNLPRPANHTPLVHPPDSSPHNSSACLGFTEWQHSLLMCVSQLGVTLAEGALYPFIQVISEDVEQDWTQYQLLGGNAP